MIKFLIGLAITVFYILAIIDIVKSSKTAGKKVLWILLVVIVPLAGMIVYYIVGRKN